MTGKERREQLLDVGRRLFAERGFEGTSIEEIAAQAGVSKPVVYEHFGGKEGLYAVVVDREVERLLAMATSLLDGNHTRDEVRGRGGEPVPVHRRQRRRVPHPGPGLQPRIGNRNLRHAAERHRRPGGVHPGRLPVSRGQDPKLAPLYAQMLVGMVAFTGQWWLDAHKPKLEEVAANLIDLAWNGLSHLDPNGRRSRRVSSPAQRGRRGASRPVTRRARDSGRARSAALRPPTPRSRRSCRWRCAGPGPGGRPRPGSRCTPRAEHDDFRWSYP